MKLTKGLIGAWTFMIVCILLGGFLGIKIIGTQTGAVDYSLIWPMVGGTFLGLLVFTAFYTIGKIRNGHLPEFDERTASMLKRYLLIVGYLFFVGSSIALLALFAIGVKTIETGMLILVLAVVYLVVGLGAAVVSKL